MANPRHSKHWKNVEMEAARFFGAERVPLSGINSRHDTHSDSLHPKLYIETKYRTKHYAVALYLETLPKSRAEGKPLVIALKQHHQGRREGDPPFLIVIDPKDIPKLAVLLEEKQGISPCQKKRNPPKLSPRTWKRSHNTCSIKDP